MFSSKMRSAVAVMSGGAALYGIMNAYHANNEAKITPSWKTHNNNTMVLPSRFSASCATKVGYTADGKVTPDDMMLYWASGSPFCWSLMIALEEKGLSGYKNKLLTMSNKEHKSDEVLALNPRGQVPTFKHGGVVLNESLAACDYIAYIYADQGTDLLPADPATQALVLQRKYESNNLYEKGIRQYLFYTRKDKTIDEEDMKTRKEAFLNELKTWDDLLAKGEKPYLAGKDFTLADVILYPGLALMVRLGLELEPRFPNLAQYYKVVTDRPSVQASWPPHWKDSPRGNSYKDV